MLASRSGELRRIRSVNLLFAANRRSKRDFPALAVSERKLAHHSFPVSSHSTAQSSCRRSASAGRVGRHHTNGVPGLDFLDKLSQATRNAQASDRESMRHACHWKATIMLFPRHKVAYKKNAESCGMWLPLPNSRNRFSARSTSAD